MCLLSYLKVYYLQTIFLILCYIDSSISSLSNDFSSVKSELCRFKINGEGAIDLSPLANSSQPLIESTTTSLYIYHPCTDIPLNTKLITECQKSFGLCLFVPDKPTDKPIDFKQALSNETFGHFSLLALSPEAVFRENELKQPEFVYKHTNKQNLLITTTIKLVCNQGVDSYKLTADKSTPSEHVLTLTSKHACVHIPHYMSGGSVFFLILFVIIALYFIGGILVLKFIRGATGVEMIPNHEFWCSKVPQMTRNGIAYLTSCGKNTPDSYEKI